MAIETIKLHTAWIMERGGEQRIHQIIDISKIVWGRVRDDVSTATVTISADEDSSQAEALEQLVTGTGRYELAIWRGGIRVWEGPITLVTFTRTGVEIMARDVMFYTMRLALSKTYDNSFHDGIDGTTYVVQRALDILTYELTRKDTVELALGMPSANMLPWVVGHQTLTDARTSRKTAPYQYTVFEHIDDMAAKGGMDYTVVGRALHLWDTSKPAMGYTQKASENDFLGELYVSIYGMELGTRSIATDGQGHFGSFGDADAFYGLVERLDSLYDEEATDQPTQSELESQAQRNLVGRNPTPLQVRIPDNSSLNMDGVLTIDDLVPGVYVPLVAQFGIVKVSQMQKLNTVKVTEEPTGETVQVTLFPASQPDEEAP